MPRQKELNLYDQRYRLVYRAGARFWNPHQPHPRLMELAASLPAGSRCIEFGCGEGHEARALAGLGHIVTAVDLSPIAIAKAESETPAGLPITFLFGDVTDLSMVGIENDAFDLGSDVGCLHMMADEIDRSHYLIEARRVLKPGGRFFLQNGLALDDAQPVTDEERQAVESLKQFMAGNMPGTLSPRTILTPHGETEIELPLLPNGPMRSLQGYTNELSDAGFTIVSAERSGAANYRFEAVIVARA